MGFSNNSTIINKIRKKRPTKKFLITFNRLNKNPILKNKNLETVKKINLFKSNNKITF